MEGIQELAQGPRENILKCEMTLKSGSVIYIQGSLKKKKGKWLKPEFNTHSDATPGVWRHKAELSLLERCNHFAPLDVRKAESNNTAPCTFF